MKYIFKKICSIYIVLNAFCMTLIPPLQAMQSSPYPTYELRGNHEIIIRPISESCSLQPLSIFEKVFIGLFGIAFVALGCFAVYDSHRKYQDEQKNKYLSDQNNINSLTDQYSSALAWALDNNKQAFEQFVVNKYIGSLNPFAEYAHELQIDAERANSCLSYLQSELKHTTLTDVDHTKVTEFCAQYSMLLTHLAEIWKYFYQSFGYHLHNNTPKEHICC